MKEEYPSARLIKSYLVDECKDLKIYIFDKIDSTNTEAKRGAYPIGSVLIAREQTSGRGRLGKTFYSPSGGIYLSVLVRPRKKDLDKMTRTAGHALIGAIKKSTGFDTEIRRINDIYKGDLKVCGILTEAISDPKTAELKAIVIGAGLNVFPLRGGFPEELKNIAGSLFEAESENISKNLLAAEIINALFLSA